MAWFKVDDQFGSHPKVMQIPRSERHACLGLWLHAGVWSAQHLTDGRIPDYMLEEFGATVSQRDTLVTVGLWTEERDGIAFKDWKDHQPTRAEVMAAREKERRRKEAYRNRKAGNTGQSPAGTPADADAGHQQESGHPDPTRPDPTPTKEEVTNVTSSSLSDSNESDEESVLLPSDWAPNRRHFDYAVSLGLDPEYQLARFREHAERNQRRQKNWNTAFTNWLKKGAELAQQRQTSGQQLARPAAKLTAGAKARSIADDLRRQGL